MGCGASTPRQADEQRPASRVSQKDSDQSGKGEGAKGGAAPAVEEMEAWWRSKVTPGQCTDKYELKKVLGRGASSVVREGVSKASGTKVACKVMTIKGKDSEQMEASRRNILREVEVWSSVNHPSIVNLIEFFVDATTVTIVMEMCRGGTLLDEVLVRGGYTVEEARVIFKQVLEAINNMHKNQVVHRDIKLENLLLQKKGNLKSIKLADMGFAVRLDDTGHYYSMAGTPAYLSPEMVSVIQGRANKRLFTAATDMWAAGVSLFILLGGYPPFDAQNTKAVFKRVVLDEVWFDSPVWGSVNEPAKRLIHNLLNKDCNERLTAAEALEHEFIVGNWQAEASPGASDGGQMLGESFQNLKAYLGGSVCARAAAHLQTGEMDPFDETLEGDPLHASSLEESMVPSKFLEMQERHDASHGRHLNESLRKIFNRNANQTEAQTRQEMKRAEKRGVVSPVKAKPPMSATIQEEAKFPSGPSTPMALAQEELEERALCAPVSAQTNKLSPQFFARDSVLPELGDSSRPSTGPQLGTPNHTSQSQATGGKAAGPPSLIAQQEQHEQQRLHQQRQQQHLQQRMRQQSQYEQLLQQQQQQGLQQQTQQQRHQQNTQPLAYHYPHQHPSPSTHQPAQPWQQQRPTQQLPQQSVRQHSNPSTGRQTVMSFDPSMGRHGSPAQSSASISSDQSMNGAAMMHPSSFGAPSTKQPGTGSYFGSSQGGQAASLYSNNQHQPSPSCGVSSNSGGVRIAGQPLYVRKVLRPDVAVQNRK